MIRRRHHTLSLTRSSFAALAVAQGKGATQQTLALVAGGLEHDKIQGFIKGFADFRPREAQLLQVFSVDRQIFETMGTSLVAADFRLQTLDTAELFPAPEFRLGKHIHALQQR